MTVLYWDTQSDCPACGTKKPVGGVPMTRDGLGKCGVCETGVAPDLARALNLIRADIADAVSGFDGSIEDLRRGLR